MNLRRPCLHLSLFVTALLLGAAIACVAHAEEPAEEPAAEESAEEPAAVEPAAVEPAAPPVVEEPTPDPMAHRGLAGTWLLDKEASEDMDPLLAALGRSRMKRALAKRIKTVVHEVTVSEAGISIRIKAGPMDETSELLFGQAGETFVVGGTATVTARLDGSEVVAEGDMEIDGVAARFRTERSLQDADTTLIVRSLELEGAEPVSVRRIFRRQP